jgi:peptidoglycan hydrolase CwlO-like protein
LTIGNYDSIDTIVVALDNSVSELENEVKELKDKITRIENQLKYKNDYISVLVSSLKNNALKKLKKTTLELKGGAK